MTKGEGKAEVIELQAVLERDADFIRAAMRSVDSGGAGSRDERDVGS
jgi:hypothetical protein